MRTPDPLRRPAHFWTLAEASDPCISNSEEALVEARRADQELAPVIRVATSRRARHGQGERRPARQADAERSMGVGSGVRPTRLASPEVITSRDIVGETFIAV